MNIGREDPDGVLPATSTSVGVVPVELSGLSWAGPTTAARWTAHSPHARVTGDQRRGGCAIDFAGGVRVAIDTDLGHGVNIVAYPGLVRREFVGPRGQATATAMCPPTLPMVIVQWAGAASARATVKWESGDAPPHVGVDGGTVVSHTPRAVEVEWGDGPARSIVLSVGDSVVVQRCFNAAKHASAHAAAAGRGPDSEILSLETGVDEIDDGVAWLTSRVGGFALEGEDDATLARAVAALAVGSSAPAERALTVLGDHAAEVALLAGQLGRATGRTGAARRIATGHLAAASSDTGSTMMADGLEALADALRYGATEEEVGGLRARAKRAREGARSSGRRLPTIGSSRPTDADGWWGALLRGRPTNRDAKTPDRSLRGLPHRFRTTPDAAWSDWRTRISEGLSNHGEGPASWSPNGLVEAELLLAFVHGLLGYAADAPSGQFHLRPAIPSHWTAFACRGVPLGEAGVRLSYDKSTAGHRFTFTPEWGSVPASLVFGPSVPGPVRAVHIDGEAAPLEVSSSAERSAIQLQLPVDDERTVFLAS
ncbi:MAG: hypothetical protein AAF389_00065 [Gemmatimonadota bacterium]